LEIDFEKIEYLIDYAKYSEAKEEIKKCKRENRGKTDLLYLKILESLIPVVIDRGKYRAR
jgi:hypothetical protein